MSRFFLRLSRSFQSAGLFIAAVYLLVPARPAAAAEHPNIVWITAEDMSANLGCYGDGYAVTPNLDRFTEESVRFTHVFATAPVCSPARSCLITGLYATTLGTQRLRSDFPIPDLIRGFPHFLREAGYFTTNNVKTDYNTSDEPRLIAESWDASSPTAHWRDRDDPNRRFFAVFNDMTTHQSRSMVWPRERFEAEVQSELTADEIHDPDKAPAPPYYPDTPVVRRTIARYYDCITAMDKHVGKILADLEADGLADDTIVIFCSDHGAGLPRHKRALYDSGMHVPLMIRFPERWKRLAPAGPGETIDRLVSFVDFPPAILALAGLEPPDYMQGEIFLGPDAAAPREFVFGARDRIDEVFDLSRSVRDSRFLYIRNFMPHLPLHQPSAYPDQGDIRAAIEYAAANGELQGAAAAYVAAPRPAEELYDTETDPHQTRNLAADSEHAETLARLRAALRDWMLETRDLGLIPEADIRKRTEADGSTTPFELARSGSPPPLADILAAAEKVGAKPEPAADAAEPDDPAVRFWNVIASRAAPATDVDSQLLAAALDDPAPDVRIEAAAALVADTSAAPSPAAAMKAGNLLVAELAGDNPAAVLRAARTLELLPPDRRPAGTEPAMRQTLARWEGNADTPLALFIEFSLKSALGIEVSF